MQITRRALIRTLSIAAYAQQAPAADISRYRTLYKLGRLVLGAAKEQGAFDSKAVDCPVVFYEFGRFYMTYIGFDGTGYQTGLASSSDLVSWKREGCILRRDPSSPITRY